MRSFSTQVSDGEGEGLPNVRLLGLPSHTESLEAQLSILCIQRACIDAQDCLKQH